MANWQPEVKATPRRWLILILFSINSANKAFQYIQMSACTKKLAFFYNVDNWVINTTSVIFMMAFVLLSWPACLLIERVGLRRAVLWGSFLAALGSSLKLLASNEQGIAFLFVSLILVSTGEQLIFSIPNRLASVWFPDNEVSRAVALCVFGNQMGVALGYIVPQLFMDGRESKDEISDGLWWMFFWNAILSVASYVTDYFLYEEEPRRPPGKARLAQIQTEQANRSDQRPSLTQQVRELAQEAGQQLRNNQIVLLTLSYTINLAVIGANQTLIDQSIQPLWPGESYLVGTSGFLILAAGAVASPIWGWILDRNHQYRLMNQLLTLMSLISLALFGAAIWWSYSKWPIYAGAVLTGIFQTGLVLVGLEMGVEVAYPRPELVTATILNVSPQIFGSILVFVASWVLDNLGLISVNLLYAFLLLVSLILLLSTRETLNRQAAAKGQATSQECEENQ